MGGREIGRQPVEITDLGISLAFLSPFFSVQSYGLYVADVRGEIFTQYQATCYVSKHTMIWSTTKVNDACARPQHVARQKLGYQPIAHTKL